jgi:ribosomal protein S18 acetylase RimI-like enzyme
VTKDKQSIGHSWSLDPCSSADMERLFEVHRLAMGPYIERVWGWDEADQRERFREFEKPELRKIMVGRSVVGILDVDRTADEIFVGTIELVPAVQGRGLGGAILQDLMAEAQSAGVPLRLEVLKINERARKLYQSLGFVPCGANDTHVEMVKPPTRSLSTI